MQDSADTLWNRFGGEAGLRKIVDDFVTAVITDPLVNYTRGGRFKLDEKKIAVTKQETFEFLSQAIGGPYRYSGRTLSEIHEGMRISDSEFDASTAHFRRALEKNGVDSPAVETAMRMVEGTRSLIVGL